MDEDEKQEAQRCLGTEPMGQRAQRYLKQALGIDVDRRDVPPGGVLEFLYAYTIDYLMARRRVCKRIADERSEGGYIMRSLRTDPLVPFTATSTYDPIGRRAEYPLSAEVRELAEMERRLEELAAAWKKDQERS